MWAVRVALLVGVGMVLAVVGDPVDHRALQRHRAEAGQYVLDRLVGPEGAVREQPVVADRDADGRQHVQVTISARSAASTASFHSRTIAVRHPTNGAITPIRLPICLPRVMEVPLSCPISGPSIQVFGRACNEWLSGMAESKKRKQKRGIDDPALYAGLTDDGERADRRRLLEQLHGAGRQLRDARGGRARGPPRDAARGVRPQRRQPLHAHRGGARGRHRPALCARRAAQPRPPESPPAREALLRPRHRGRTDPARVPRCRPVQGRDPGGVARRGAVDGAHRGRRPARGRQLAAEPGRRRARAQHALRGGGAAARSR